jgi:hypothetical protein
MNISIEQKQVTHEIVTMQMSKDEARDLHYLLDVLTYQKIILNEPIKLFLNGVISDLKFILSDLPDFAD